MARKRKVSTDELLGLVDQFKLDKPDELITPPKLGRYIRAQGRDVPDHLIRRNIQVKNYIAEKNKGSTIVALQSVSAYKTMDVDSFLERNRTHSQLKKALMERDRYYSNIAMSACELFKQYESMKEELAIEKDNIEKLKKRINELEKKKKDGTDASANRSICLLKRIVKTNVYPEIANELLRKAGLVDFSGNRVIPETVVEETVNADTDVIDELDNIEAALMKGFDQ